MNESSPTGSVAHLNADVVKTVALLERIADPTNPYWTGRNSYGPAVIKGVIRHIVTQNTVTDIVISCRSLQDATGIASVKTAGRWLRYITSIGIATLVADRHRWSTKACRFTITVTDNREQGGTAPQINLSTSQSQPSPLPRQTAVPPCRWTVEDDDYRDAFSYRGLGQTAGLLVYVAANLLPDGRFNLADLYPHCPRSPVTVRRGARRLIAAGEWVDHGDGTMSMPETGEGWAETARRHGVAGASRVRREKHVRQRETFRRFAADMVRIAVAKAARLAARLREDTVVLDQTGRRVDLRTGQIIEPCDPIPQPFASLPPEPPDWAVMEDDHARAA